MTQSVDTRSLIPDLLSWTRTHHLTLRTLCAAMAAFRDTYTEGYPFPQAWEDLNFGDAANIPEHIEEAFASIC